jgi:hypothetical protein
VAKFDPSDLEDSSEEMSLSRSKSNGAISNISGMLGIDEDESKEIQRFVRGTRIREWARHFRRSDPRYQILNFFNDVAQEGADQMGEEFNPAMISPLLRAFYKASVFTVWRPTSYDAIRRMMLGEGVGKGLDIKGKSAKKGKLSGFVPFLQICEEEHKSEIRTLPKDGKIRVFYSNKEDRDKVVSYLRFVEKEMVATVKKARSIVENDSIEDDDTNEWALEKLIWDMTDTSVAEIDDYKPVKFGMDVPERLFWEGMIIRHSIQRKPGSENDTGRPSAPSFQDMNFSALRPKKEGTKSKAVLLHYIDPNDKNPDPMNVLDLLMAYEENDRVMPVVSDFDCFLMGTRGVQYSEPIPENQLAVSKWCVEQIESILDGEKTSRSWTSRWLDVLKQAASKGFHPDSPPLGFSDPKSNSIMSHAISRLKKEGAVRHGAECFNFSFPQDLDDEFLVISDNLSGQTLPWKYVDKTGLQEILKDKIQTGYTFPINPKWILCDPGWKDVFAMLKKSQSPNVQDSLRAWYPETSGILEMIDAISKRCPEGFVRKEEKGGDSDDERFDEADGTAAMDLAELELKYFLTLQRSKKKMRGFLLWKGLLDDQRKRVRQIKETEQKGQEQ